MEKTGELKKWIEIADGDLSAAEHLFNDVEPRLDEIVCFHCQQCAEKYLKWVIAISGVEPPKINALPELEKMCEKINPHFSELAEKCDVLTEYTMLTRYPNAKQIDAADASRALFCANKIRDFVRDHYKDKL